MPNVFEWLDHVRQRPSMYAPKLHDLESMLCGYYAGLGHHQTIEQVPEMTHHFRHWVRHKTGWSVSGGWGYAIEQEIDYYEDQVQKFFELVDEYRELKPICLCSVELTEHHQPTGKRRVIGRDGRMDKPGRIDIVQYQPEPLHFIRFYFQQAIVDDSLLFNSIDCYGTTLGDAQKWVLDELQVQQHEWDMKCE